MWRSGENAETSQERNSYNSYKRTKVGNGRSNTPIKTLAMRLEPNGAKQVRILQSKCLKKIKED